MTTIERELGERFATQHDEAFAPRPFRTTAAERRPPRRRELAGVVALLAVQAVTVAIVGVRREQAARPDDGSATAPGLTRLSRLPLVPLPHGWAAPVEAALRSTDARGTRVRLARRVTPPGAPGGWQYYVVSTGANVTCEVVGTWAGNTSIGCGADRGTTRGDRPSFAMSGGGATYGPAIYGLLHDDVAAIAFAINGRMLHPTIAGGAWYARLRPGERDTDITAIVLTGTDGLTTRSAPPWSSPSGRVYHWTTTVDGAWAGETWLADGPTLRVRTRVPGSRVHAADCVRDAVVDLTTGATQVYDARTDTVHTDGFAPPIDDRAGTWDDLARALRTADSLSPTAAPTGTLDGRAVVTVGAAMGVLVDPATHVPLAVFRRRGAAGIRPDPGRITSFSARPATAAALEALDLRHQHPDARIIDTPDPAAHPPDATGPATTERPCGIG